jgi:5'-deoxynucleotidase YfbR-like HD superfamily hydrolase
MHDAHEAYVGDIPTPVKYFLGHTFRDVEEGIRDAISARLELLDLVAVDDIVKQADLEALYFERKNFLPESSDWEIFEGIEYKEELERFLPYYNNQNPEAHERLFLDRAVELLLCSPSLVVSS